jgi:hypothetical protein
MDTAQLSRPSCRCVTKKPNRRAGPNAPLTKVLEAHQLRLKTMRLIKKGDKTRFLRSSFLTSFVQVLFHCVLRNAQSTSNSLLAKTFGVQTQNLFSHSHSLWYASTVPSHANPSSSRKSADFLKTIPWLTFSVRHRVPKGSN